MADPTQSSTTSEAVDNVINNNPGTSNARNEAASASFITDGFDIEKFGTNLVDGVTTFGKNLVGGAIEATGLAPGIQRLQGLGVLPGGEKIASIFGINSAGAWQDMRIKIKIPPTYLQGPAEWIRQSGDGGVVFPYTPQIVIQTRANYNALQPTHSNYAFQAYQNSSLDAISIVGTFTAQNEGDGRYMLGAMHALRACTKMNFGASSYQGAPPPVLRLSGYGEYMFNDLPIVISSFFYTLNEDVDYLTIKDPSGGTTSVPTRAEFTIECLPAFSRRDQASFSIDTFVTGELRSKGFI